MTKASPKERLKVKYKVKTGGKGEGQRLKVAEGVMEKDNDSSLSYMNTAVESQPLLQSRTQPVSPGYEYYIIKKKNQMWKNPHAYFVSSLYMQSDF